jgi:hypothetical protein
VVSNIANDSPALDDFCPLRILIELDPNFTISSRASCQSRKYFVIYMEPESLFGLFDPFGDQLSVIGRKCMTAGGPLLVVRREISFL